MYYFFQINLLRNIFRMFLSFFYNLKKYQNWVKLRLEARHKAANGNLVEDSLVLGKALHRIPGPGFKVPLEKDEKALPALDDIDELEAEVKILIDALNLQSASGVVVSAN